MNGLAAAGEWPTLARTEIYRGISNAGSTGATHSPFHGRLGRRHSQQLSQPLQVAVTVEPVSLQVTAEGDAKTKALSLPQTSANISQLISHSGEDMDYAMKARSLYS